MKKRLAYCGIVCNECPAYLATKSGDFSQLKKVAKDWSSDSMVFKPEEIKCLGCYQDEMIFSWCSQCPIRECSRGKGYVNCAYCDDYVCDNLKMTFDKTPAAKERLDEIKKRL